MHTKNPWPVQRPSLSLELPRWIGRSSHDFRGKLIGWVSLGQNSLWTSSLSVRIPSFDTYCHATDGMCSVRCIWTQAWQGHYTIAGGIGGCHSQVSVLRSRLDGADLLRPALASCMTSTSLLWLPRRCRALSEEDAFLYLACYRFWIYPSRLLTPCIVFSLYTSFLVNVMPTATTSYEMARHGDLFVACLLPLRGRGSARWLRRRIFRVPVCFARGAVPSEDAE